jgi:uncharacterized protein
VINFEAWQLGSTMCDTNPSAQSPCVGYCCLDDDNTCLGCFRSLDEIKEWGVVDDYRRRAILQNARQRLIARQRLDEIAPHTSE